ncbi:MAG: HEPN domain-containing protein, partial [Promethearchaeota archaeon]
NMDFKWAIIKSYYAMFHAAKALLFSVGLKEKRHFAVQIALEELSKKGKLKAIHVVNFSAAMEAREDADYRYKYSKEMVEDIMENAKKFIKEIRSMVNDFLIKSKG